ncbi:integrase core domain protein [Burkholderia mallei]|nr:integrase core domain protein [Burkholderia mallei]
MIEREQLALPGAPNEVWSIDFVVDALSNGRRVKCLTVVDDFTKEAVDIVVDHGISGLYVARALDRAACFRGYPKAVRTDQGPEFTSRALDQWAYANGVTLKLIRAGKPTQNAYIESFNGKFRDECLNEHWFTTLAHARAVIAAWRQDYNEQKAAQRTELPCAVRVLRRNIGQPRTLLPLSRSWFKGTLLEAHWPYRRGQVTMARSGRL